MTNDHESDADRSNARDVDPDRVKASLRRLTGPDDAAVIERADAAVSDLDAAAEFADSVGLERLSAAVEATDDPDRRERGERALVAFRTVRAAASGEAIHFRRGRGTDLRGHDEASSR